MDRRTPQQILAPTPNNQSRSFSAGHRPPSAALSSSSNSCLGTSHAINMQPRQSQPQLPNACDLLVLADAVLHSQNNSIRLRAANSTMTTAATHQVGPVSKPFQHAELSRDFGAAFACGRPGSGTCTSLCLRYLKQHRYRLRQLKKRGRRHNHHRHRHHYNNRIKCSLSLEQLSSSSWSLSWL